MTLLPVEKQRRIGAFFAEQGIDVSYWAALWHAYKVGHLLETDLDRTLRQVGLNMADIDLLGMLRTAPEETLRPTDLAGILNVTNAALTNRVAKLVARGLIERRPDAADRRAVVLALTPAGYAAIDAAIAAVEQQSRFVECFQQLSTADREELSRILGQLHNALDRFFTPSTRGMLQPLNK